MPIFFLLNVPIRCGKDFGFDLQRWHEHLLETDEGGYRNSYGWSVVQPAIEKALADPKRLQLAERLEQPAQHLSSEGLAVLIVDALVDASLVSKGEFIRAVEITREEIDVRKALGDY